MLVVTQVGVALALLAGTGLLVRSLWQLARIDPDSMPNALLVHLDLDPREYDDAEKS